MLKGGLASTKSAQVGVEVLVEGVTPLGAEVGVDAAQCEVHLRQPPGGGVHLPPEHGDAVAPSTAGLTNLSAWTNIPALPQAGSYTRPLNGSSISTSSWTTVRGVELAAAFALGGGELAEEVLVDAAEDVEGPVFLRRQVIPGEGVDQPSQHDRGEFPGGQFFGSTPFRDGFSRSMASMVMSMRESMSGRFAAARRSSHLCPLGGSRTPRRQGRITISVREHGPLRCPGVGMKYSEDLSSTRVASSRSRLLNTSETYFRKISPVDDVLVLRGVHVGAEVDSAASHSAASTDLAVPFDFFVLGATRSPFCPFNSQTARFGEAHVFSRVVSRT